MMSENVLNELLRQYKHFCDDCPKAYDFTCSGADAKKCNAIKQALLNRINDIQDELTQIPDAPPYKIGDEDYRDRVGDQEYRSRVTCKLIMPQPSKTFEVCKSCGRVVCKQGDHHCNRTDDEW